MAGKRIFPYGESPTYTAAHQRIRKRLGRASDHLCAVCGGQALDWSFDPSGDMEFGASGETRHSPNVEDYVALCRSCHWSADRGNYWCATHSSWTERTKYRERDGRPVEHRFCRECNREHGRRRSALIKEARELLGLSHKEYIDRYGQGRATAMRLIAEATEEKSD